MNTETAAVPTDSPAHSQEVSAADLPLYCPADNTSLWSMHPRVYLPVAEQGEARCPYCGAHYVFKGQASH